MSNVNSSYLLKSIPPEIYAIILREQNKIKAEKNKSVYSMESTIYHIIKEFDECLRAKK